MRATMPWTKSFLSANRVTERTHREARQLRWKWTVRVALAIVALMGIEPAKADSVTWTLQSLVFASGQVASGNFTVQNGNLTAWDIQITGGTNPSLTNLTFLPGGSCVVFCGELFSTTTPPPTQSGLDVRTPLAADNTFFELVLYFNNAGVSALSDTNASRIAVNSASEIDNSLLLNANVVELLSRNALRPSESASASIVQANEPATLALLCIALAVLVVLRRQMQRGEFLAFSQEPRF